MDNPDNTCHECGTPFTPKTKRSRFCTDRCRYRARDRDRRIPCATCGEPMYRGTTLLPEGQAIHRHCRRAANAAMGVGTPGWHGRNGYSNGCRCQVCKTAVAEYMREYGRRTNYWSRPDVVNRRRTYRQSPEARAKARESHRAWCAANREARRLHCKTKDSRRRNAPAIPFTPTQLEQRMSMFAGCWICRGPLGNHWHVDHVKPLAAGGWNCLANLRPACAPCNRTKGAQWPYTPLLSGGDQCPAAVTAPTTATETNSKLALQSAAYAGRQ